MSRPELIVMLTHHDFTVTDAARIFESCKESNARFWGMKEHPLPPQEMRHLYTRMKECGKTTFLEVVSYTEEEGLAGAELAVSCGCDVLMGTCFFDSINEFCLAHNLKYMPFVGKVTNRPSILSGSFDDMVAEAHKILDKGVYGIDLLGYRYDGDALKMIQFFIEKVKAPICLAGSINSAERLAEVRAVGPWTFTIGSAFFEGKFLERNTNMEDMAADSPLRLSLLCEQINRVCDYMANGII